MIYSTKNGMITNKLDDISSTIDDISSIVDVESSILGKVNMVHTKKRL